MDAMLAIGVNMLIVAALVYTFRIAMDIVERYDSYYEGWDGHDD